jgi:colanic acid/amylovoran biosynthesis glycosyltransferase
MMVLTLKQAQSTIHDLSIPVSDMKDAKVAYIMSAFPALTETFILYEILMMERLGLTIEVFPLRRLREDVVHPEVAQLAERVHFRPFFSFSILLAQLHYIRRRPLVYFKSLVEVLSGTFGSANFFFGAMAIFPKAVRFAYEMENRGIRHIHAHFATHPSVAALIIHRLTGIPFSFTAHGSDLHVDRRMLDKKVEAAAFAVTISSFNKEIMVNECGEESRDKIHIIHCGVDPEVFTYHPRLGRDGPFQILSVAAFKDVKGHKYLVEACRILKEQGVDFVCHLVGEGPLRTKVEAQIAEAGLQDQIIVDGARPRSEIVRMLSEADVLALASVPTKRGKREGIPVVLMEAMASGLPVVASNLSGIPELVENGCSGILVPPRDSGALANALWRLQEDPALRRRMAQAGRNKVVQEFNLNVNTAERAKLFFDRISEVS